MHCSLGGPLTLTLSLILTTNPNRPMNLHVLSQFLRGVYEFFNFQNMGIWFLFPIIICETNCPAPYGDRNVPGTMFA
jgi:hypothetical protein